MKTLIAVLALISLTGCASYQRNWATGCIFECDKWDKWREEGYLGAGGPVADTYTPSKGITGQTLITPVGGYQVIRSGSTTTVTRISR